MKMTIDGFIKKSLADEHKRLEAALKEVETAQKCEDLPRYFVRIHSLWSNEGEKDANASGKVLEDAIKRAEQRFLETNRRSDIQAQYFVYVKVGGIDFSIPANFFEGMKLRNEW